jgi:hypothetical protein
MSRGIDVLMNGPQHITRAVRTILIPQCSCRAQWPLGAIAEVGEEPHLQTVPTCNVGACADRVQTILSLYQVLRLEGDPTGWKWRRSYQEIYPGDLPTGYDPTPHRAPGRHPGALSSHHAPPLPPQSGRSAADGAGVLVLPRVRSAASRRPRPRGMPHVDPLARQRIAERVRDKQHQAWNKAKRTGLSFVGARRALGAWTAGDRSACFPEGTWWMRLCHGARCGPAP